MEAVAPTVLLPFSSSSFKIYANNEDDEEMK